MLQMKIIFKILRSKSAQGYLLGLVRGVIYSLITYWVYTLSQQFFLLNYVKQLTTDEPINSGSEKSFTKSVLSQSTNRILSKNSVTYSSLNNNSNLFIFFVKLRNWKYQIIVLYIWLPNFQFLMQTNYIGISWIGMNLRKNFR